MTTTDNALAQRGQPGVRQSRAPFWNRRTQRTLGKILAYTFMTAASVIFLVPLFWMLSTALKTQAQTYLFPPQWIPNPIKWDTFSKVFQYVPFAKFVGNTLILVAFNMIGNLWSCTLIAYGFARLRFPLRNFWFMVLIGTMMLPGQVTMIPTFILFKKIGWYNTYLPLIVPSFFGGAFFVFLVRQYMMTLPYELDDAARIDGCGRFRLLYSIILPLCKPPMTIIAVYTFMGTWNDLMGPLIYLNTVGKYTVAQGLAMLNSGPTSRANMPLMMSAALISVMPCLILYYFAQDLLIGGIASVGLKG